MSSIRIILPILSVTLALTSCAVVEAGGQLMNRVGDGLTDYSKDKDGFIGKAAGVAGNVYSTVGTATQEVARGDNKNNAASSASTQASSPAK